MKHIQFLLAGGFLDDLPKGNWRCTVKCVVSDFDVISELQFLSHRNSSNFMTNMTVGQSFSTKLDIFIVLTKLDIFEVQTPNTSRFML